MKKIKELLTPERPARNVGRLSFLKYEEVARKFVKCLICGSPEPEYHIIDHGWFHRKCLEKEMEKL